MDDYSNQINEPSEEVKKEALKYPNGYIYILEKEYQGKDDVPADKILGAWKVNETGVIVGPFILNPNYKHKLS
ncbi:hypothetical protein [Chryseolinea lacunae]|uniref:Uncharacterized protein n=1 Tax=Chryseolinea lacunae TaxID=2801331 RepID=A0ABS1KPM2_9BACT|nr:hypothetical protein [Chryseolinea lacunae]MBL0741390.1 hypothetical protein [Chryseolinea lacunae]